MQIDVITHRRAVKSPHGAAVHDKKSEAELLTLKT